MSFIKLLIALISIVLSGCSSSPNYDKAANCGSATPVCLALAAATDAATNSGGSSQKCSDMSGDSKRQCDAQVEAVKKHINDASHK
jgi:hypothetical protein